MRLVKCDFSTPGESCPNATVSPLADGYYRVFTPEIVTDSDGDPETVVLDFCTLTHLTGWALQKEVKL